MTFRIDTPFYPIPGAQPEATFGAIMEILLKTRIKLHLETHRDRHDEEVNTYLAGLLASYIDPEYLTAISEVLSQYEIDVYQAVSRSKEKFQIYWIYKVNADDLLLTLGIFRPLPSEAGKGLIRVKRYYACASDYQRRIYGRSTAVGEVQTKLAEETERYVRILSEARSDYFHFVGRLGPEELTAFHERLKQYEKQLPLQAKRDEFLDAYSQWMKGSRDPSLRQRLLALSEELKSLDPSFPADGLRSQLG